MGYPDYRDRDRLFFYFWDLVENDPLCLGMIYMKHRREGASFRAQCILYEFTSKRFNVHSGMQSKNKADADLLYKEKCIGPFTRLPFFFQPIYKGKTDPASGLFFFEPPRTQSRNKMTIQEDVSLRSWIDTNSAKSEAYDSQKLYRYHGDEFGKTTEENVIDTWNVASTCLTTGADGKAIITSTVAEMEKKGGDKFKAIWEQSDMGERDANGETSSGLYRFFMPAYLGLETKKKKYFDEYGNSIIDEALTYITNKREGLIRQGNYAKLSEFKRQYPLTVREAFRSGLSRDYFNTDVLQSRLEYYTFKDNQYKDCVRGNFEWVDGVEDSRVRFQPLSTGRFHRSWDFDSVSDSNNYVVHRGLRIPGRSHQIISGADPFKYNDVKNPSRASLGGGAAFLKRDISIDPDGKDMMEWETNMFILDYLSRPKDKYRGRDIYCEDMLMMCIYLGCEMNTEIDVPVVWDYFNKRGYSGYLFYKIDERNRLAKTPGSNTTDKLKEQMFGLFASHIEFHGMREKHYRILEQCNEVEYDNITKYDLFVAAGYALLGAASRFHSRDPKKGSGKVYQPLFATYDYSGDIARPIQKRVASIDPDKSFKEKQKELEKRGLILTGSF